MMNSIDIDIDRITVARNDAATAVSGVPVPGLGSTSC